MKKSRKHEIGVGILVVSALILLAFMAIKVGSLRNVGDEINVKVIVGDAAGLSEGAAVRIAGVQVGQIGQMSVIHNKAELSVMLSKSANVRTDASMQVRARSILGEKYLEISPVSTDATLLKDGDTIEVSVPQTEIDELVNSLGPLVTAVDADALNAAMKRVSAALEDDPERIANILRNLETILDNGAQASASLPELVNETRATLDGVRTLTEETRPMIREANEVVSRVETSTQNLPQMSANLEETLQESKALMTDGRALMEQIQASTQNIQTVLDNMSEIDKWELRRLLREEGILIRMKRDEVQPND